MNRDSLIRSLALSPDVLEGFLAGLTDELVDRSRGKGFWTIREHVVHLADVQPMLFGRMESFRDEVHPVMKPYHPEDEDEAFRMSTGLIAAATKYRMWREKQTELLYDLDDTVWNRRGEHPEYDSYGLEILVSHTHFHDGFHLYRMEEMAFVRDRSLTTLP